MDYLLKEKIDCSCGSTNIFYNTEALNKNLFCISCGKKLENPNVIANLEEFAKKTLPRGTKFSIMDSNIWISTHIAGELLLETGFGKNVKSIQTQIREKINKGIIKGEKIGRIYRVAWPSIFDYVNKKQIEVVRGKSTKEIALELGITVARLYKYLQNDDHPKYYGIKGDNNRWIIKER